MLFQRLGKIFSVILLAITPLAHAKIVCPALTTVQQAVSKLDRTQFGDGFYIVSTSAPVFSESGLKWFVEVRAIAARSPGAAILAAKRELQRAYIRNADLATQMNENEFNCRYRPGVIIANGHKG